MEGLSVCSTEAARHPLTSNIVSRLIHHAGLPRPASDESLDGRGASDNLLAHTNSSKGTALRITLLAFLGVVCPAACIPPRCMHG